MLAQKLRRRYFVPSETQVQRVYYNMRDENFMAIATALDRCLHLQNVRQRTGLTEERVFKIKQFNDYQLEAYQTALGVACSLDQTCNSTENTGLCQPLLIIDIKKRTQTEINLFQRKFNPSNPFYRNPQYKAVFCYTMWVYE